MQHQPTQQARIISAPLHRVRFCDFWLADQLNSLVPILLDIEYTSCFYLTSSDLYGNVGKFEMRSQDLNSPQVCFIAQTIESP